MTKTSFTFIKNTSRLEFLIYITDNPLRPFMFITNLVKIHIFQIKILIQKDFD